MNSGNKKKFYEATWFMWVTLVFFAPVGIFLMWKYNRFRRTARLVTSIGFGLFCILIVASANSAPANTSTGKAVTTAKVVAEKKEKTDADAKVKADADASIKLFQSNYYCYSRVLD